MPTKNEEIKATKIIKEYAKTLPVFPMPNLEGTDFIQYIRKIRGSQIIKSGVKVDKLGKKIITHVMYDVPTPRMSDPVQYLTRAVKLNGPEGLTKAVEEYMELYKKSMVILQSKATPVTKEKSSETSGDQSSPSL